MRIAAIDVFPVQAGAPPRTAWGGGGSSHLASSRVWTFVKITTESGLVGWGEGSGWPLVVAAALRDVAPLLLGEEATDGARLLAKVRAAAMGHGDTGVVLGGVLAALDMALTDITARSLGVPVWRLLGGRLRERIPCYAHAPTPEAAEEALRRGYRAVKCGGVAEPVARARRIRAAIGDEADLLVDLHGPPWFAAADAIAICRALEPLDPLFVEEPLPPEDLPGWRRLRAATIVPLAAGERAVNGPEPLLAEGLVDVVQPDTGRAGGLRAMLNLAAAAEARGIQLAPHSGSLGPLAEVAALHLLAVIPNALILERMDPDWAGRADLLPGAPSLQPDGTLPVPEGPGLGAAPDEAFLCAHPATRNLGLPKGGWATGTEREYAWRQMRRSRRHLLRPPGSQQD